VFGKLAEAAKPAAAATSRSNHRQCLFFTFINLNVSGTNGQMEAIQYCCSNVSADQKQMIHMAAELLFVDTVIRDERFMHQVLQC
jgi:hypothetical protein